MGEHNEDQQRPGTRSDNSPGKRQDRRTDQRLDTWKEIGAFFGRDERTVKRWEDQRGLPVHRVPGSGRGSVYAYTSELSEWLKTAETRVSVTTTVDDPPSSSEIPAVADAATALNSISSADTAALNTPTETENTGGKTWLYVAAVVAAVLMVG